MLRVISLGAGVQSTALALMAANDLLGEKPTHAIFADTQWEPDHVYKHLDYLERYLRTKDIKIVRATAGNLRDAAISNKTYIPFYVAVEEGKKAVIQSRQCTRDYKIRPIRRVVRDLLGLKHTGRSKANLCEMWIGISLDELTRTRDSAVNYITNRYPLIELGMSREDCQAVNEEFGFHDVRKSSCMGCPFHSKREWLEMRETDPTAWADAVEVDELIRNNHKLKGKAYLHRDGVPLTSLHDDDVEGGEWDFDMECEGMCGV